MSPDKSSLHETSPFFSGSPAHRGSAGQATLFPACPDAQTSGEKERSPAQPAPELNGLRGSISDRPTADCPPLNRPSAIPMATGR